jgi:hypothetical protein
VIQNPPEGSQREELERLVEQFDVAKLIQTFDVDYDIPLAHGTAIGLLYMRRAFATRPNDGAPALAARVGAFWCDIVRSDVEFDLRHALARIDESAPDAERLIGLVQDGDASGDFPPYVAARWSDGAGKVLYRIGSHSRGRMRFRTACDLALANHLWWCLPDLRSNLLRAQLEEARQAAGQGADRPRAVVEELETERRLCEEAAADRRIPLDGHRPPEARDREFLRGYSSLLHNLSYAIQDADPARSLATSERASAISSGLHDGYREAQALNHQALVIDRHYAKLGRDKSDAEQLYERLLSLGWIRGQRIAVQNLARIRGDLTGAHQLAQLLDELATEGLARGGSAGLDIDLRAYTVTAYASVTAKLAAARQGPETADLERDARKRELEMARSVRQVIALPAYKRAYSRTVRPIYLESIERRINTQDPEDHRPETERWEEVLSLTEESSARELLDLISSTALPLLPPPDELMAAGAGEKGMTFAAPSPSAPSPVDRRSGLRRPADDRALEDDRLALIEREREFEEQFLRQPLDAAPYDDEIALRAQMLVTNNPGTCIVRYFTYGLERKSGRPTHMGAFIISDGVFRLVPCGVLDPVRDLVRQLLSVQAPLEEHSRRIWELLIEPIWPSACNGGVPSHLVLIPADDMFAVPFQIASSTGDTNTSTPLGALVPLSLSVSLTAFVTRGRHLLRRQRVSCDDDLAALVIADEGVHAGELVSAAWSPEHLLVAGTPPPDLTGNFREYDADWFGLAKLTEARPEFFLYAGHGSFSPGYEELGPFLQMRTRDGGTERLTSYDVALRVRLPRNRLSILGACLAGQGAPTAGGDVVGFLRGFMAAGAGAIAIPYWQVLDSAMADTAGHLLAESRQAAQSSGVFDVVQVLQEHYRTVVDKAAWIEHLPLALYT